MSDQRSPTITEEVYLASIKMHVARIEKLEAALRQIEDPYGDGYVLCQEIARAALEPEPLPKTILDEPTSPPEQDK